jgi:hypothetical protein
MANTESMKMCNAVARRAAAPVMHRVLPRVLASMLVAVSWLLSTSAFAAARLPTLQDLDIGNTESSLSLSSDSKMVAVDENGDLIVLSYPSGHVIAELGDGQRPRWSPLGDTLGFYSVRSGTMQLTDYIQEWH